MTEKITYVADDGTEFDYEDDCRDYECFGILIPYFENVQLWDACEKPISIPTNYAEMCEALEEMVYARGEVEEFILAIYDNDMESEMLNYYTFKQEATSANENDLLMYDGDADCWVNVNSLFDDYRRILKMFGNRG